MSEANVGNALAGAPKTPMSQFEIVAATQEPDLSTAMKVVYQWNYGSEVEELRSLYVCWLRELGSRLIH